MAVDIIKKIKEVFKDFDQEISLSEAIVVMINLYKKTNTLEVILKSENNINLKELTIFEQYLKDKFKVENISIKLKDIVNKNINMQEEWENIIIYLSNKYHLLKAMLNASTVDINSNSLKISLRVKGADFLYTRNFDKILQETFENLYGLIYKVEFVENINEELLLTYKAQNEKIQKDAILQAQKFTPKTESKEKNIVQEEVKETQQDEKSPLILGRNANIKEQLMKIIDLTVDSGKIALAR